MNGDLNQQNNQPMGGAGNQMPMQPKTPQPGGSNSQMWLVVVVVILVVVVFGWMYWAGYFVLPTVEAPESDPLGVNGIEADLGSVNVNDLDSELSDIEAELNAQ